MSAAPPTTPTKTPKSAPTRRRPIHPASAEALAMLNRLPIFNAAVPRLHVRPSGADGSIQVDDRANDRTFLVFTPRRASQFRAGYRAGLWYVQTPGTPDDAPRSQGFPSKQAAIDAIHVPAHPSPRTASPRSACRVLWS